MSDTQDKDSMKNILVIALSVCLVCAIVVSGAAVSLKPQRLANKELDRNKNILIAAGLFEKDVSPILSYSLKGNGCKIPLSDQLKCPKNISV